VVSIAVTFKHEDEVDGEPIGPVFIYDEDEPEDSWTGHLDDISGPTGGWRTLSDARAWAASRGYSFHED
jgi:hypothetical protein